MARIGINAKLYYRSGGSHGSPTFTEISGIADLAVNPTWDEASADDRSDRVHRMVKTMMGLEISGNIKTVPGNTAYDVIANALVGDTVLDFLVLSGSKDNVGERGWRFDGQVFAGNQDQAMANVLYDAIVIKPTDSDNPVQAVVVGAGPALTFSTPGANGGTFA